jgi:hypothetical protein
MLQMVVALLIIIYDRNMFIVLRGLYYKTSYSAVIYGFS